jgi:hypothetical protein
MVRPIPHGNPEPPLGVTADVREMVGATKTDRIIGFEAGTPRMAPELEWAHNRPADHRPPAVSAGDRVLYRSNDWFEPVPAIVVTVLDAPGSDANRTGMDPWPAVILRIDPDRIPASWDKRQRALAKLDIKTWEARLAGSAGYLHPLWMMFPQMKTGGR